MLKGVKNINKKNLKITNTYIYNVKLQYESTCSKCIFRPKY